MEALCTPREEMVTLVATQRILRALKSWLTSLILHTIAPGASLCVYRERSRTWEGPFFVHRVADKETWLLDRTGSLTQFEHSATPT